MAREDAPVTLDELADLQAGLLEPDEAQRLRLRVAHDPEAARLLGALELVAAELDSVEDEPVPDNVVARLDAAVDDEQGATSRRPSPSSGAAVVPGTTGTTAPPGSAGATPPPGTTGATRPVDGAPGVGGPGRSDRTAADEPARVVDLDAARRRRRRVGSAVGVAVAAAAVIGAVVVLRPSTPAPVPASVPAYGATDLASAWPEVAGLRDLGPLGDAARLQACRTVAGTPDAEVIGARPVTLDGRAGVLVASPAPPAATGPQVTLIVFDPACGADAVLARTTVPR